MRIPEGIEREIALFPDGVVATQVRDQRVGELMQAEGKDPAEEDDSESHVRLFIPRIPWDASCATPRRWK